MIQDRDASRRFFIEVWQKYKTQQPLEALEQSILTIILKHPEYHADLDAPEILNIEFTPERGVTNPFLHMGLHVALYEQVQTDRPAGIRAIYQLLASKSTLDLHAMEHRMIDCLAEALWSAQTNNTLPDEVAYLERLRKLG